MIHARLMSLVLLLAVLAPCAAPAQSTPSLSAELLTPTDQLRLGGVVQFTVLLRNTDTQRSVVLRGEPGFGPAGGMELVITDGQGVSRSLPATSGDMTLEQAQTGTRRMLLPPGHGHAVYRQMPVQTLFPSVGQYQLRVNYSSPMPTPGNPSVASNAIEGSQATTATVAIEVVE